MADQTQRLEIATVRAEVGSNIVYRFANDAAAAGPIPTESGGIQNLKQVILEIQAEAAEKISISTTIYPTVAAGLGATANQEIFLVQSNDADEIYTVWQNQGGTAVNTGKTALSATAIQTALDASNQAAQAAEQAADNATARTAGFLAPTSLAPSTRDNGLPLEQGDRYFNTAEQAEYIYTADGWEANDSQQAIADLESKIVESPAPESVPRSGPDGKIDPDWIGDSVYDYADLRAYGGKAKRIRVTKPGVDGWFRSRGITTGFSDNGGTFIIGSSGQVWERIYSGPISVLWFDCPMDGVSSADFAFAKFTAVLKTGEAIIPPIKYAVSSINFNLIGQSPTVGGLKVYAYGATIIGECVIRIDSCKRLRIEGIEGVSTDLQLNGAWYLNCAGLKLRDIVLGASAGAQFSSNYWNAFVESQFQSIVTNASGTQGNNQFRWSDCQFRGDASQGYTSTRNYFIQFLANQDAQSWTFEGCDISYYLVDMIYVADSNAEDIQVDFQNCYFDSKYPSLASRPKTRLTTYNCQAANDMPNSVRIGQACRGSQDAWRSDRAAGWKSYSAFNLIPNGDLYDRLASYVGASLPILSSNSAVVTALTGGGQNGNYLNINQSLTANNQVRFRPKNLPFTSRYTGVLVMRNAAAGVKSVRVSVAGLFFTAVLSSTDWTMVTLTTGSDLTAGSTTGDILLLTEDNTGFNVDVCYIGMFAGENPPMFLPSAKPQSLYASATWDPPSIAAGSQTTLNVPVPGSASGDFCLASFSNPLQGLQLSASYLGSEMIQVVLRNGTSSAIDLASGTLRVKVEKTHTKKRHPVLVDGAL